MRVIHDCWKCELCSHTWLAFDNAPPAQCAKCRSRKWNASGIDRTIEPSAPENQAADLPNAAFSSAKSTQTITDELKSRLEPENASIEDVEPESHWQRDEFSQV